MDCGASGEGMRDAELDIGAGIGSAAIDAGTGNGEQRGGAARQAGAGFLFGYSGPARHCRGQSFAARSGQILPRLSA